MENELLFQLGINWKLFLSQVVNFFILLLVLTFFVYKPLIRIIKERSKKIKEGLEKAEEADVRLKEIDIIGAGKIREAEQKGIEIIKATEVKAKILDKEEKINEKKFSQGFLKLLQKQGDLKKSREIINSAKILLAKKEGNKVVVLESARKLSAG